MIEAFYSIIFFIFGVGEGWIGEISFRLINI